MCEGHRSTGWTFYLWESAIYLEDISPNHPNKTKQPTYQPPTPTPTHTQLLFGERMYSTLNCQGQGRPVLQEFREGAVLVNNFPDASGALDSLLSGTFCMKMLRAQGEGTARMYILACARGMPLSETGFL